MKILAFNKEQIFIINGKGELFNLNSRTFGPVLENHKICSIIPSYNDHASFFVISDNGEAWEFVLPRAENDEVVENANFIVNQINIENKKIIDIAPGWTHELLLTDSGEVYGRGGDRGVFGSITNIDYKDFTKLNLDFSVKKIAAGRKTSFLIDSNGTLMASGDNTDGVLGLGEEEESLVFTECFTNKKVTQVCTSGSFSAILSDDGIVYTCGYLGYHSLVPQGNKFQQLNQSTPRFTEIQIMGDLLTAKMNNGQISMWGHKLSLPTSPILAIFSFNEELIVINNHEILAMGNSILFKKENETESRFDHYIKPILSDTSKSLKDELTKGINAKVRNSFFDVSVKGESNENEPDNKNVEGKKL